MQAKSLGNDAHRVDMLEIPGKGRCYVYLARSEFYLTLILTAS
jgi:hypothetical protein